MKARQHGWRAVVSRWLALVSGIAFSTSASPAAESRERLAVVFVHGILDDGKIFTPLIGRLEQDGFECFAPSLDPNDCRHGIRNLGQQLSRKIETRFGSSRPLVLIGFSMGGLITRDYVQNLAPKKRIRGVFLISTPHRGTLWASLSPNGRGVKDLSFRSPFVQKLNADREAWKTVPVFSYWTPFDLMVVPATSSRWHVGEVRKVFCPLHQRMVRTPKVMADIAARLRAMTQGKL